jgi:glycosyltransferase involved in cell wall biosynthesis
VAEDRAEVVQLLGPSTGGIRQHVTFLTKELRARGWWTETAGPARVLEGLGGVDHVVPVPSGLRPRAIPGAVRELRRVMRGRRLLHAHGLTAGWIAVFARGRRRRFGVVLTVHNVVLDEVVGRAAFVLRGLERSLARRVDRIIAVSQQIADDLAKAAPGVPIVTIGPLGPPPVPRRSVAEVRAALGALDGPLIVCVARLHPQKGLDVLLEAMPEIAGAVPTVHLAIVGEGPERAALEVLVERLRLDARVSFVVPSNPADELAAADVVVIPSRWESGPLVLTEALLLERPVVATPVGSVTQLVTDGDTGWLVPVGEVGALASALIAALRDPDEAARRAAEGRARAEIVVDPDRRVSLVTDAYRATLVRR